MWRLWKVAFFHTVYNACSLNWSVLIANHLCLPNLVRGNFLSHFRTIDFIFRWFWRCHLLMGRFIFFIKLMQIERNHYCDTSCCVNPTCIVTGPCCSFGIYLSKKLKCVTLVSIGNVSYVTQAVSTQINFNTRKQL